MSVAINPDNEILDVYRLDNYAPRRRSIALDVPFNTYYPGDSYQYRILPIGYYNDVDGGKAGLRLRGGYDNYYRKFTLQGLYGFESEKNRLSTPRTKARSATSGRTRRSSPRCSSAREGRERRSSCARSAENRSSIRSRSAWPSSVRYHEINDTSYVFPAPYEMGRDIVGGLRFEISPEDRCLRLVALARVRSLALVERFQFREVHRRRRGSGRRYGSISPSSRTCDSSSVTRRIDPPLQERFGLAGANTLAKERFFWLRSVGAFPRDQYNNFHVAGDANLRGYYDGTFAFKRVFASNVELQLPFPLPVSRKVSRMLDRRLCLFFDWGKVLDERSARGDSRVRGAQGSRARSTASSPTSA